MWAFLPRSGLDTDEPVQYGCSMSSSMQAIDLRDQLAEALHQVR